MLQDLKIETIIIFLIKQEWKNAFLHGALDVFIDVMILLLRNKFERY